jgi:hypothetical protein
MILSGSIDVGTVIRDGSNGSGIGENRTERRTIRAAWPFLGAKLSLELSAVSELTSWFADPALA